MARTIAQELTFRPATPDDAPFAADVMTALFPRSPWDPISLRYWWSQPDESMEIARLIVLRGDRPIGFAHIDHARWDAQPERYASIWGDLMPAERTGDLLRAFLAAMEERLRADGARTIRVRAEEDDALRIDAILARGYKEDRRQKRWELDVVANRERLLALTAESRARMDAEGVKLLTLADDRDPDVIKKIWRLSEEAGEDVPTTMPRIPEAMESYVRWTRAPEIHRDRFWIARIGDDVVGLSVLGYPPVRGIVGTEWTATARSVRGRGIARALKCETLAQAIGLGVDRVRTGNDEANAPILHLNQTMGYHLTPASINYLRPV
ncbi:MAG TPA: GNAT family N-acetyltransferase [Candidatus Bathyarchaeia archaeon]|nr:GNAT family N-acetyltransferase [Candidatus Bathyarchaeia archaeon]